MKKLNAMWLTVMLGSLAGVLAVYCLSRRGPAYDGRRLDDWFKQYYRNGPYSQRGEEGRRQEALHAIRAIGTNALPYLIGECFSESQDSPLATNLLPLLTEAGFPVFVSTEQIRETAAELVCEIKPPAGFLLASLGPVLTRTNVIDRYHVLYLLGGVGEGAEAAVPYLIAALRSTNAWEQAAAAQSVARLSPQVKAVVPELAGTLKRSSAERWLTWRLAAALRSYGTNAAAAVPVLKEKINGETDPRTRMVLAVTLCKIDVDEPAGVQALCELVRGESDERTRRAAANALGDLGQDARAAVPVLMEMVRTQKSETWWSAAYALKRIGVETHALAESVAQRLTNLDSAPRSAAASPGADELTRYSLATFVLGVEPTNTTAMSALIEIVRQDSRRRRTAIHDLGGLGPAAKAAIPVLRELAASDDSRLRDEAQSALSKIEAEAREPGAVSQP